MRESENRSRGEDDIERKQRREETRRERVRYRRCGKPRKEVT